jgi:hypothetical protein
MLLLLLLKLSNTAACPASLLLSSWMQAARTALCHITLLPTLIMLLFTTKHAPPPSNPAETAAQYGTASDVLAHGTCSSGTWHMQLPRNKQQPGQHLTDGSALIHRLSNHVHDAAQSATAHRHLQQQCSHNSAR